MSRWLFAALLPLLVAAVVSPAQAAERAAKSDQIVVGGAALQLEASRRSLYDIPYLLVELGAGIGFQKPRSALSFGWMGIFGSGQTQNGLTVWTLGSTASVDISFWKLHAEPTMGFGLMGVDRITQPDTLVGLTWPVALYAGPSLDLDGSHLAIDLDLRADFARKVTHPDYGLRVRYTFF